MKIFENLTVFEQRILCHTLPKSFDNIPISIYLKLFGNKAIKIIQSMKRQKLNEQLEKYENDIQYFEHLYQTEIENLEFTIREITLYNPNIQVGNIITQLKEYLNHYTNRLMHQIRYKEACLHIKFVRQHRKRMLSQHETIDVYPRIIVDVSNVALNKMELDYLSRTGKQNLFL